MRRQPSRLVLVHLLTLVSLLLNLVPSLAPHALATAATSPTPSSLTLRAPSIPDPLIAPFIDPARAALTAALGTTDPTLLANAAPSRLEQLAPVAPVAPAVTRPAPPDPLAHLSSGAPPAAGLDTLTQQRANLAATDTLTPTDSASTGSSRAPPVTPTASAAPRTASPVTAAASTRPAVSSAAPALPAVDTTTPSATKPVTATLALAAHQIYLPLIQTGTTPSSAPPAPTPVTTPPTTVTPDPAPAPQNTLLITPDHAATLRSADGSLEISIPAGAVTSAITITYQALADQAVPGFRSAGVRFALTAVDAQGQAVHQFQRDLTLRVPYTPQAGLDVAGLKLYFTDATHPDWTALPSVVDASANTLVATSTHFTHFALLQPAQAPTSTIIVDDQDAGFQHFTQGGINEWSSIPCAGDCWAGHAYWSYNRSDFNGGDLSLPWDWATWTPVLPEDGYYKVEAWIPAPNATTTGATYVIAHADGVSSVTVDQSAVSGAWQQLGAYRFTAGSAGSVYLDDVVPEQVNPNKGTAAKIGFDAVRFIYAGLTPPADMDLIPPVIHYMVGLTQLPACAPFQPAGSQPRPRWGRSETGGWQDG